MLRNFVDVTSITTSSKNALSSVKIYFISHPFHSQASLSRLPTCLIDCGEVFHALRMS